MTPDASPSPATMPIAHAFGLALQPGTPDVVAFVGGGGKSSAMFALAREVATSGQRVVTTTTTRIASSQIEAAPAFVPVPADVLPLAQIAAALDAHNHCMLIGRETVDAGEIDKRAGIQPVAIDALVAQGPALELSAILIEADGSRMLPLKAPAAHEPVLPGTMTLLVTVAGLDAVGKPLDDRYIHRPEIVRARLDLPSDDPTLRITPAHIAALLSDPRSGRKGQGEARALALLNKVDLPGRLPAARLAADLLVRQGMCAVLSAFKCVDDPMGRRQPVRECWAPWTAVILAAGASKRMGQPKQLLSVDGQSMLVRAVRTALTADATEVMVVVGAHEDAVRQELHANFGLAHPQLRVVYNGEWPQGQSTSMHAALLALEKSTEAVLFLPVDQPLLAPVLLRRMVRAWQQGADLVAPQVNGQLRGAPCLFGRLYWPELLRVQGDIGGRDVLRRHADAAATIPVAAQQLRDIDTPAALTALRGVDVG